MLSVLLFYVHTLYATWDALVHLFAQLDEGQRAPCWERERGGGSRRLSVELSRR